MKESALARTPLYAWHSGHGAQMVDFAGWSMPVHYGSIVDEHQATRQQASLFDVSHMGRFLFRGPQVGSWLDSLLTRRCGKMSAGRIRYSLITNEAGGILDDVLVYHLVDPHGQTAHWLVVNASNRAKIWNWLQAHGMADHVELAEDRTLQTAMIAVQGPLARELVRQTFGLEPLAKMNYYTGRWLPVEGQEWLVSRTGYTGEDGAELIVPADIAGEVWQRLCDAGAELGVRPAGLAARDTLRLEAAMPLYGHELNEQITPWQAGLDMAVDLEGRQFPGREALAQQERTALPRRVGLRFVGRRVGREGAAVLAPAGEAVGQITSGTFSPTLQYPIAMAYVAAPFAELGTALTVDLRGKPAAVQVVPLPFYQRKNAS